MTAFAFSIVFVAALALSIVIRFWLASRQVRHVAAHRAAVPGPFAQRIALSAHQRAADYTIARTGLALVEIALGAVVLVGFTLLGGLRELHALVAQWMPGSPFLRQVALVALVAAIGGVLDLPLGWYRQFRLEQRFGFNRMTLRLWVADLAKGTLLGAALGLPLVAAVIWLMQRAGDAWWFWAWLVWMGFNVTILVLYPTVIAPLFNKFEPMSEGPVRARVEALLARCGFASKGLFVMDGSRRSAHGNAYFTGMGRAKRIVFFDTLLSRLSGEEVEAVLAHELGHFKHRHITQRIVVSFALSLAGLWLLGWLARQSWFYQGLGVPVVADVEAVALLLFFLVLPTFTFLLQPIASLASRRHEFQADAFAARQSSAQDLASALVKLYEDNAATLTPDPIHSAFYDSHPPAAQRIGRLNALAAGGVPA
ncbi:MAG: M48 family metallopeptidase [Burkholderiaceae bacterium]